MRSFGPDDLEPPREFDGVVKPKGEFELVIGPKQLAIALFLLVTQAGLVAGIAYTAGKSAAQKTAPVAAVPAPAPVPSPAAAQAVPSEPAAPPTAESAPAEPAAAVSKSDEGPVAPPAGLYLQTASIGLAPARHSVLELARKGYQARLAPGDRDGSYRVLVGPLPGGQVQGVADSLRQAGFACFPKRY